MSDPLDLIAEAQRRQREAEEDLKYWKMRAGEERKRLKRIIAIVKNRDIEIPDITLDGVPYWKNINKIVEQFVEVIQDPYARFPDEDGDMSHDQAKNLLEYRIGKIIEGAIAKDREQRGGD